MEATVNIIKQLVADFNAKLVGIYTDPIGLGSGLQTIKVCETSHLRPGSIITIGIIEYEVVSIVGTLITLKGGSTITTSGTFAFPEVFFFHGTPIMVGSELNNIRDSEAKTPFIYLYEVLEDEFIEEVGSSIERNSNLRLFFLDQANFKDWDTEHHYSEAIVPMNKLSAEFIHFLKTNGNIGLFPNFSLIYHANFTIKYTTNGHETRLFNDELSGVELKINLPIKKSFVCSDCF